MRNQILRVLVGSTLAVGLIAGSAVAANADTGKPEISQSSITTAPPVAVQLTPEQEKSVKGLENTGPALLAAASSTTTDAKEFDYSKALALRAKAEQVANYASVWQAVGQKVVNLPAGVTVVALEKTSASTFQAAAVALQNCAANGTGITLHLTGVPWCGAQS